MTNPMEKFLFLRNLFKFSLQANPGIEEGIRQINEKIDDHNHTGNKKNNCLNHEGPAGWWQDRPLYTPSRHRRSRVRRRLLLYYRTPFSVRETLGPRYIGTLVCQHWLGWCGSRYQRKRNSHNHVWPFQTDKRSVTAVIFCQLLFMACSHLPTFI